MIGYGLLLRGRNHWPSDGGGANRGYQLSPSDYGWHLPLLRGLPTNGNDTTPREHNVFEVRRGWMQCFRAGALSPPGHSRPG